MKTPKYEEPFTPVERELRRRILRRRILAAILFLALVAFLSYRYSPNRPVTYSHILEHFKYGSIGSDIENGFPLRLLKVLPRMFPEYLPEGAPRDYTAFGFLLEPGREMPIGFSKRRRLVDVVGFNCSICHTGSVRESEHSQPKIYLGMPANTVNLQAFFTFLFACAGDNRFTSDNILAEIEKDGRLFFLDRLLYRNAIPSVQAGLLKHQAQLSVFSGPGRPKFGPGRVDTFNPYKTNQFAEAYRDYVFPDAEIVGTADFPSIWDQKMREGMNLHWDGNNASVRERNFSAAFGAGATRENVASDSIDRIAEWLRTFPPPPYPFGKANDRPVVARGEKVYTQYCANCHSVGGRYVGQVIPLAEIETDPYRLNSYTQKLVALQLDYGKGYEWEFKNFKKTNGYAAAPLDGIWARAPYLHNGSVPTLWDLLTPADRRNKGNKTFYTGHGVYDTVDVGFRTDVSQVDGRKSFVFDVTEPGNSNSGHSGARYGTESSDVEKRALIEYLKTL
jgi:hypothetical protein